MSKEKPPTNESEDLTIAMTKFYAKRKVNNRAIKLTEKLMYILECLSAKFGTIISWSLDGKSVIVHNREAFVDIIIAIFFKQGTFDSFCRKMRRWGFTTKSVKHDDDGEVKWSFHHPDFNKAGSFGCCERVMTTAKKIKKIDIGDLSKSSGNTRQAIHERMTDHSSDLMKNERNPENPESSNKKIPPILFPSSVGATIGDLNVKSFADSKMSPTLLPLRNQEHLLKDSFNAESEMRREQYGDKKNLDPSLGVNKSSLHPNATPQQHNHIGQSLLQKLFFPPVGRNTMSPLQGNAAVFSNITQDNLSLEIVRRQLMASQNHDNATLFSYALDRQYPEQFHRQHPLTGRLDDTVMWREFLQTRIHGQINHQGQHDSSAAIPMSQSQHLHEDLHQNQRALQHRIGNAQQNGTQENSSAMFRQVQRNSTVGSVPSASQLLGVVQQDMILADGSQGMTIDEYKILLQHLQRSQH